MPRPSLPVEERRTEVLQVRLSKAEKSELEAGAAALGVSAGALMREAGLEKARHNKSLKRDRAKSRAAP